MRAIDAIGQSNKGWVRGMREVGCCRWLPLQMELQLQRHQCQCQCQCQV